MEYSKEDLMEAKKQIWGVGENMGTEESKKIWEENAQFWDSFQLMSMRRYKDTILASCRDALVKRNGIESLYPDNGRCPLLSRGICHTSIPRGNTSMCHVFNELMSRGKHQSITNQAI